MRLAGLAEIFSGNPQHAKAFTVFLVEVLVVHLMGLPYRSEVGVFGVSEPIEPPVNENVVHQKIAEPVGCDAGANPKTKICMYAARDEAPGAGHSKNQEEGVVLFKEPRLVLMVVLMEIPHHTMHQVFVCSPSHPLHGEEGDRYNQKSSQDFHGNNDSPIKNAACRISNNPAARLVRKVKALRHVQAKAKAMSHQLM